MSEGRLESFLVLERVVSSAAGLPPEEELSEVTDVARGSCDVWKATGVNSTEDGSLFEERAMLWEEPHATLVMCWSTKEEMS